MPVNMADHSFPLPKFYKNPYNQNSLRYTYNVIEI